MRWTHGDSHLAMCSTTVVDEPELAAMAADQLALAWVLRRLGMLAIPKAGSVEHVR